jgi:hypothetical protein
MLHMCAQHENTYNLMLLMAKGCDVNTPDRVCDTIVV